MSVDGLELRDLGDADIADAYRLSRRAFGFPATESPLPEHLPAGAVEHGAFLRGRLVGQAIDLIDRQWWGGRLLGAADIAGVAVAAESRGHGIARALIARLLDRAHERGAVVSALFPSISSVYRTFGWATAGRIEGLALPTATLARLPMPDGVEVSDGTVDDLPGIHEAYRRIAVAGNGLLDRETTRFDGETQRWPSGVDGLTVVRRDAEITGYCLWSRGRSYGHGSVLTVEEILATDRDSARALVATLGTWHPVTPMLHFDLLGGDAIDDALPLELGDPRRPHSWMHRPVDIEGAVTGRGWPAGARGQAVFHLADALAPWNSGTWALDIGDGGGELKRTGDDTAVSLSVAGFASLYCGLATVESLRRAGHVSGPHDDAAALDVLATSAPPRLFDSF